MEQTQGNEEDATYYNDMSVNGRSRLTEVVVKQEVTDPKERDHSGRELLGMPSYMTQITNARKSKRGRHNKDDTSLESIDTPPAKKAARSRVAIMSKTRKRRSSQNNEMNPEDASPKDNSDVSITETSTDDSGSVRRSSRLSSGKPPPRFLD